MCSGRELQISVAATGIIITRLHSIYGMTLHSCETVRGGSANVAWLLTVLLSCVTGWRSAASDTTLRVHKYDT